ncbi:M56 family metallopeptidase [Dyadobacter crusticola]|uniref:M56 family metallopeptidase n=1 Tax=Dyadobacter crusticola TaxID=292407 RepID=UPI0004E0F6C4|nr:M56 family metallopeptidase [Dyadobacter crusticola]
MSPLFEYLIKLSASLAVVAIFHYLFLRRLTFYNLNRIYLRFYSLLCFVVPFISIEATVERIPAIGNASVLKQMPVVSTIQQPQVTAGTVQPMNTAEFDIETWIFRLLVAGMVVMLGRLLLHIVAYVRILRQAQLVSDEDVRIYHIEKKISPFSFGNAIFYNPEMHSEAELAEIILHEYIHVRQRHTHDVIWGEILCILNWYNPFAWLIRHEIRLNLEYIADQCVLENDVDAKQYQYLLLKCAGGPDFRISNAFNISSLKQRIVMMNKKRSSRIFLISFVLAIPLLVGLLIFFGPGKATQEEDPFTMFLQDSKGNLREPSVLSKEIHAAGLILEARTGKPLANIPLEISRYGKHIKTVKTDAQGYYYALLPAKTSNVGFDPKKFMPNSYTISYEGGKFSSFSLSEFPIYDTFDMGSFWVVFEKEGLGGVQFYSVNKKPLLTTYNGNNIETEIRAFIKSSVSPFLAEHNLRAEFKEKVAYPTEVLTKYKNGLFDRKKTLVGYDGHIKLYLDGKPATYKEINEAFQNYPYMLDETKEHRDWEENGLYKSIAYLTFDLYKTPPPAKLLANNVEWHRIEDFDLDKLEKEAYFLDGFRQIFGVGSNLRPLKKEIRRIALFKGRLAKYYDPKLERVWWIETRPEAEVFERPDLALAP